MNMSPNSAAKPSLGVVAIAKNEERDLPGFLRHLLPWVDEIVLVDDGSNDRTCEIASAAGDKVKLIERRMTTEGGFAEQRNVGIQAASADWLLHMDIDERVTPELAHELRAAIAATTHNAFRYRRLNFFLHRPMNAGGWQYWNKPQLARRGRHAFANKLHEECIVEGGAKSTGQLQAKMLHLNDESYVERVRKNMQYMQFSGDSILQRGVRVRWYHLLFHPLFRAFKSYFLQHGYRAGTQGVVLALYTFAGTFNWWAYAWDRQQGIDRDDLEKSIQQVWDQHAGRSGARDG
jgi:(heptosyl)LPS beta-1,4-glucosyltransferase